MWESILANLVKIYFSIMHETQNILRTSEGFLPTFKKIPCLSLVVKPNSDVDLSGCWVNYCLISKIYTRFKLALN